MSSFLLKNKETIIQGLQVVMIGGIIYYVYKNINKLKKDVKSNRQLISSHDIMLSEQNDLVIKINESLDMLQQNQQIIIRNSITNGKTEKYDNSEKSVENIKYETSNISHEVIKNNFSDIKYPNTIYETSNTQKDLNDEIAEELRELEIELLDKEIIDLEKVEPKVEEVVHKVEKVEPKVEEVVHKVEKVEPKVEEVEPKVEEVKPKVEEVEPKVEEKIEVILSEEEEIEIKREEKVDVKTIPLVSVSFPKVNKEIPLNTDRFEEVLD